MGTSKVKGGNKGRHSPPRKMVLRVLSGPQAGALFPLASTTTQVGSDPEAAAISLAGRGIAPAHLALDPSADGLRITTLEKKAGFWIGDTKLRSATVSGPVRLRIGDETELEIAPAAEDAPPSPTEPPSDEAFFGASYGVSAPMVALFRLARQVALSDCTLLIAGETGSGKDLLAEAIHGASRRAAHPYVVVDCGAMPHDLIAAELFGHVRGAFTGAASANPGLTVRADGGTLFLDEIGELPLDLQPKLLRLLERREVRPVGDSEPRRVDVRIIAATNRDLRRMVADGQFRRDLYFRLAVVHLEVPPLRARLDDIPGLVRHFAGQLGRPLDRISPEMMAALVQHDWPGNVRELRNVVERGLVLPTAKLELEEGPGGGLRAQSATKREAAPLDPALLERPFKEAKALLTDRFERAYLEPLLERHGGNISRAAKAAGIDRNHIHRLVRKLGLAVGRE